MALKNNRIIANLKILYQGFKGYKKQILILTVLGVVSAGAEGIGINALIPLFSFITGAGAGDDFISRAIKESFSLLHIEFRLKYLLVFICLLFVFKAIFSVLCEYIRIKITADYEANSRNGLFKRFLKADWPYLLKQKLGHLETVLITNIQTSSTILSYISSFVIIITSLAIYILIAINISLRVTLFSLLLSGIIFLIFKPLMKKMRTISYAKEKINRETAHHINENILGLKTVKTMAVGDKIAVKGRENFEVIKKIQIKTNLMQSVTGALMQPISIVFVIILFSFAFKSPNFNLAAFAAVIYLIKQIFSYMEALQKKVLSFHAVIPYYKNVLDYEKKAMENAEANDGTDEFIFKDKLELQKINFSYNGDKEILSDIDFSIEKGEMVGLIGPSGAGKTTVVDLILRLFRPDSGKILLDGKSADKIALNEWRKNIGYVSQDIFLMNGTIEKNIKFYNNEISDQDMAEAAKMANIYDFIESCPKKFLTEIGERGIELSAGQRQRIVIARILARKPRLLVFDEATSALDNESETKIQKVIENLKGKITVFVIAHRLSTIINSDRLLVLENGRITEQGKPAELLNDEKSYFYKVYNIRK